MQLNIFSSEIKYTDTTNKKNNVNNKCVDLSSCLFVKHIC